MKTFFLKSQHVVNKIQTQIKNSLKQPLKKKTFHIYFVLNLEIG